MSGDVSVRRGDNGDVVAAAINAPLMVGDRILTGPDGRAEVQFDSANMIRVAPNSEIRLAELAYRHYQIQVARGTGTYRVLRPSTADVEVSTPQASIRPQKLGVYRLTVREDGQSELTVRAGDVEVFTPQGAETLQAGKTMQMRGTATDPEFQVIAATGEDEWDRWNSDRDRVLMRAVSPRYVSQDVTGADDLDPYGRWVPDPTYGQVWAPAEPAGWAPYQAGRWVWMDYYGWTWVSSDPWGWAPYHYGRWFVSPGIGWCWYPGGVGFGVRHYWSPALVAFVGFGGVGVGSRLLDTERSAGCRSRHSKVFRHPWYGRGFGGGFGGGGFGGTTIVNNVSVYNTYRNARVANGVTSISRTGFASGQSGSAFTGNIRQASLVQGRLPVTPTRQSMQLSNRAVNPSAVSRASTNNQFFSSRRTPGPGAQSQSGWKQFGQPSVGSGAGQARTAPSNAANSGWGRFGTPAAAQSSRSVAPASANPNGWQRSNPGTAQRSTQSAPRPAGSGSTSTYRSPAGGGSTPQSVRMNPTMVRERPAPSSSSSSSHSSSGGSHGGGKSTTKR